MDNFLFPVPGFKRVTLNLFLEKFSHVFIICNELGSDDGMDE